MPRNAYVNGRYLPHTEGTVHIEDCGNQFAVLVYANGHPGSVALSLREASFDIAEKRQA